jgi:hypothetical protein
MKAINAALAGGAVITIRSLMPGKAIAQASAYWEEDESRVDGKPGLGGQSALEELAKSIEATSDYQES